MSGSGDLWAITCHFNPVGYQRRVLNYRVFRERLSVPLVAVELAFDNDYELGPEDADVLVQLRSPDVLWHKERLLNIALERVPESVDKIAWLDADIVFPDECWHERTSAALDSSPIVQPFSHLHDLPKDHSPGAEVDLEQTATRSSIVYLLNTGAVSWEVFQTPTSTLRHNSAVGLGWAARADLLRTHGLYDALVLGSGDKVLVGAAVGAIEESMDAYLMSPAQREHYLAWARPFHEDVAGRVGHVEQSLVHLWHGDLRDRGYDQRYREFAAFSFDPHTDIARDASGCWHWSSDKPSMHAYARDYFASRKEDG